MKIERIFFEEGKTTVGGVSISSWLIAFVVAAVCEVIAVWWSRV
jgi:hypothetical protein